MENNFGLMIILSEENKKRVRYFASGVMRNNLFTGVVHDYFGGGCRQTKEIINGHVLSCEESEGDCSDKFTLEDWEIVTGSLDYAEEFVAEKESDDYIYHTKSNFQDGKTDWESNKDNTKGFMELGSVIVPVNVGLTRLNLEHYKKLLLKNDSIVAVA